MNINRHTQTSRFCIDFRPSVLDVDASVFQSRDSVYYGTSVLIPHHVHEHQQHQRRLARQLAPSLHIAYRILHIAYPIFLFPISHCLTFCALCLLSLLF